MGKKKKEADDDEDEGGGGKKKIIMIVGGLAAVGAVYNFVLKKPPPEEAMTPEELAASLEPVEGAIVPMEEMILNLGGTEDGYLKISLAIVLDELTLAEEFEEELPIAQDVAVQYLSSQSPEKFETPEGRQAAKEELSTLVKEAYHGEKVIRVLFTSLVMQ
jgi:flagellar basal body-associated protein FliL